MTNSMLDVPYEEDGEAQLFVSWGWADHETQELYGVEHGGFYRVTGEATCVMIAAQYNCSAELIRLAERSAMKKLRALDDKAWQAVAEAVLGQEE